MAQTAGDGSDSDKRGVEPDDDALLDLSSELSQTASPNGVIHSVNRAWRDTLGYSDQDLQRLLVLDIVHPDHQQAMSDLIRGVTQQPGSNAFESVLVTRTGASTPVSGRMDCRFEAGTPTLLRAVMRDLRAEREADATLRDTHQLFRNVFESPAIGMAILGLDGRWQDVNDTFSEMLGYSHAELLGKTLHDITLPDDLEQTLESLNHLLRGEGRRLQMEKRYVHRDGSVVTVLLTVSAVTDPAGAPNRFVSQIQDITARKQLETRLVHRASHDVLTGLPNRALFMERLDHALARGQRDNERIVVMFLDLDGFKSVNDRFGHEHGDRLLVEVGRRLRACARTGDTVARHGGDEFTILLEQVRHQSIATEVAQRVLETLRYPVMLGEHVTTITPSIGIAASIGPDDRADALLHAADTAMYDAKRAGKDRAVIAQRGNRHQEFGPFGQTPDAYCLSPVASS
ncbi:MAG: diguanylate cyclase [Thermomicrobiales bacterium]